MDECIFLDLNEDKMEFFPFGTKTKFNLLIRKLRKLTARIKPEVQSFRLWIKLQIPH